MPCVMADARPEGDGGWGTLSAVGLSLMLSLWPGTFSFLAVSHLKHLRTRQKVKVRPKPHNH